MLFNLLRWLAVEWDMSYGQRIMELDPSFLYHVFYQTSLTLGGKTFKCTLLPRYP